MKRIRLLAPGREFRYAAKHPLDFAEVLSRNGYEVEVVSPMAPDVKNSHLGRGFHLSSLVDGSLSQLLLGRTVFGRVLLSFVRGLPKVDVTIGVDPLGFIVGHLLKRLGRTDHLIYYTMELCLPEEVPQQRTVRYQAQHIRDADEVITTGYHRARVMQQRFDLREHPIIVSNSFVLTDAISDSNLRARMLQAGFTPSSNLVVFGGKIFPQHALAEVVQSMRDWIPDTALVLVGYGDSEYVQRLHELAEVYGVAERFCYLGEVLPGSRNILRLISGASVGLVLKKYRNAILNDVYYTPSKLLEYAAMGVPAICSDQESLRHVETEGWGLCVDPENPKEIAEAVNSILSDPERRRKMGATAQRLFEEKYCMEEQMKPVLKALEALT